MSDLAALDSVLETPPSRIDDKRLVLLELSPLRNGVVIDRDSFFRL